MFVVSRVFSLVLWLLARVHNFPLTHQASVDETLYFVIQIRINSFVPPIGNWAFHSHVLYFYIANFNLYFFRQ